MSFPKSNTSTNDPARLALLRQWLESAGASHTIIENNKNIVSAEEGAQTGVGVLAEMAPTFILHTEVGYLAAIVRGDTRLTYKKIKQKLGLKNVSLASPEEVKQLTGAEVGYVCLVNPGIKTIVDSRLTEMQTIYGGSGVPNHTLQIDPQAVIRLTQAEVFDFTEFK